MLYLICSILSSTTNHLLFKAIKQYNIVLPVAVTVNYAVCVFMGTVFSGVSAVWLPVVIKQPWFVFSFLQGGLFFFSFMLIGLTTRHHGVSIAGLSSRLSVAIPTIAAFFLYGDKVETVKLTGIGIAFLSLVLSCFKSNGTAEKTKASTFDLKLPALLFACFGLHSTLIKIVQEFYLGKTAYHSYITACFVFAFLISGLFTGTRIRAGDFRVRKKDIMAGIILGTVNYAAVFFLIRTLGVTGWESSIIFPTLSISVVIFSAMGAWLFFREKVTPPVIAAIAAGIAAIILINH